MCNWPSITDFYLKLENKHILSNFDQKRLYIFKIGTLNMFKLSFDQWSYYLKFECGFSHPVTSGPWWPISARPDWFFVQPRLECCSVARYWATRAVFVHFLDALEFKRKFYIRSMSQKFILIFLTFWNLINNS